MVNFKLLGTNKEQITFFKNKLLGTKIEQIFGKKFSIKEITDLNFD